MNERINNDSGIPMQSIMEESKIKNRSVKCFISRGASLAKVTKTSLLVEAKELSVFIICALNVRSVFFFFFLERLPCFGLSLCNLHFSYIKRNTFHLNARSSANLDNLWQTEFKCHQKKKKTVSLYITYNMLEYASSLLAL